MSSAVSDPALIRLLVEALLEVVRSTSELAQPRPSKQSAARSWLESLGPAEFRDVFTSEERDWAAMVAEMASECRRTANGDGNAYFLDDPPSFSRRPRSRRTPWGDELNHFGVSSDEVAAGRTLQRAVGVAITQPSLLTLTESGATHGKAEFLRCLDVLSRGKFLSEEPAKATAVGGNHRGAFAEAPWFSERGYSTLGHVIANKLECLAWLRWKAAQTNKLGEEAGLRRSGGGGGGRPKQLGSSAPAQSSGWHILKQQEGEINGFLTSLPASRRGQVLGGCLAAAVRRVLLPPGTPPPAPSFAPLRSRLEGLSQLAALGPPRQEHAGAHDGRLEDIAWLDREGLATSLLVVPLGWPQLLPLRRAALVALNERRAAAAAEELLASEAAHDDERPKRGAKKKKAKLKAKKSKQSPPSGPKAPSAADSDQHDSSDGENDVASAATIRALPRSEPRVPQSRKELRVRLLCISLVCDVVNEALAKVDAVHGRVDALFTEALVSQAPDFVSAGKQHHAWGGGDPWTAAGQRREPPIWGRIGGGSTPPTSFSGTADVYSSLFGSNNFFPFAFGDNVAVSRESSAPSDAAAPCEVDPSEARAVDQGDAVTRAVPPEACHKASPEAEARAPASTAAGTAARPKEKERGQSARRSVPSFPARSSSANSLAVSKPSASSKSLTSSPARSPVAAPLPRPSASKSTHKADDPRPKDALSQARQFGLGRRRGRAISDGGERVEVSPTDGPGRDRADRRWETVVTSTGSHSGHSRGQQSSDCDPLDHSAGDEDEDAEGLSWSNDVGGTISLDDLSEDRVASFDDQHASLDSRPNGHSSGGSCGSEAGSESSSGDESLDGLASRALARSRRKCGKLGEENAVLKDVALRLEAEVSKLRNVIAAQQGLTHNNAQRTSFCSVPFVQPGVGNLHAVNPAGLATHFETRFSERQEVMSDDGSGMVWPAPPPLGDPKGRLALPQGNPETPQPQNSANSHSQGYTFLIFCFLLLLPTSSLTHCRSLFAVSHFSRPHGARRPFKKAGPSAASLAGASVPPIPEAKPAEAAPVPGKAEAAAGGIAGGVGTAVGFLSRGRMSATPFSSLPPALLSSLSGGSFGSRLSRDIESFVGANDALEREGRSAKLAAFTACRREVISLWPRAQVHLYGSFVTQLSLPSSDLDLVISLPKVRSLAPAMAPGDLEGRNAIKETWQQNLSRTLRSCDWVEPSSVKIISRTAVPVMKLCTTNSGEVFERAYEAARRPPAKAAAGEALGRVLNHRAVSLDVSFEGATHSGVASCEYVRGRLAHLPAIRPLVLVLKQGLCDRSLSESYNGGLSSYALFIMVTRYVEEANPNAGTPPSAYRPFLLLMPRAWFRSYDALSRRQTLGRCCWVSSTSTGTASTRVLPESRCAAAATSIGHRTRLSSLPRYQVLPFAQLQGNHCSIWFFVCMLTADPTTPSLAPV